MEKIEKQINEAEVETALGRYFTKRTALALVGAVSLAYIMWGSHPSRAAAGSAPAHPLIVPEAPPTPVKKPAIPPQVILPDPPPDPRLGTPYSPPAAPAQTAPVDPIKELQKKHLDREVDAAFASMLVPEQKEQPAAPATPSPAAPGNAPIASESVPEYIIPESTYAAAALDSRLEGEMTGPVDAHFLEDVYLPGTRTIIIPQGSKAIGQASKVGSTQQQRLAITFTKIQRDPVRRACDIVLSDPALDQAGSTGLTGKVDNHVLSTVLGSSLVALLTGASVGIGYSGGYGGEQVIIGNMATGGAQTAGRLLDKWTNKLPRITVPEGTRVTFVWTNDTPVRTCDAS